MRERGEWLHTYKGIRFYPSAPQMDEIDIEDIGHALANVCRFGGHVKEYYSVAQHSVIVSNIIKPGFEKEGLLHDAPEAYIGDMVRPIKRVSEVGKAFKKVENIVAAAIMEKFGVGALDSDEVQIADDTILAMEARDILHGTKGWTLIRKDITPLDWTIKPLPPKEAEKLFMNRYYELFGIDKAA